MQKKSRSSIEPIEKEKEVILNRIVLLLEKTEFFITPVKRVCDMLNQVYPELHFDMKTVTQMLQKDDRFRLFEGAKIKLTPHMKALITDDEMEKMGFSQGPRVMLKNRVPSRKEVVSFLLNKADQTFETLKKAWEIRPKDDEEAEDQLLQALAKSQKLQRELRVVLDKEEEKESEEEETFSQ
jgi:hypothetical protein